MLDRKINNYKVGDWLKIVAFPEGGLIGKKVKVTEVITYPSPFKGGFNCLISESEIKSWVKPGEQLEFEFMYS